MTYQKNRKDLVHVRAFTTISTKNEGIRSRPRKPTMFHTGYASQKENDRESSGIFSRGLTFVPPRDGPRKTGEETDVKIVEAVPSNFNSVSKPSKAVERLIAKRKASHNSALEEMRMELSAAHEKCENELRERCDRMKIEMDRISKNVEKYQDKIQKTDLSILSGKDLQATWNSISGLINDEKSIIDEFHNHLCEIERNRKLRVKLVMKKYYEIFHSISHILPFEIQVLLENEIQEYNKTILKNFRVYEDLHLQMFILADSQNRELQNWLEDVNDKRRDAVCLENIKRLIRKKETLEKPDDMFMYDPNGIFARKDLNGKIIFMEDTVKNWQSQIIIFDASSVNDCSKEISQAVEEFKISIKKLVNSYKSGLQRFSERYKKEVSKLKEDKDCVLENDAKLLDKAVNSLEDSYKIVEVKFEELCDRHSTTMEVAVEEFCNFLRDSNSIWKKQSIRLNELQQIVVRRVDDLTAKNEKSIGDLEKKLNNYIIQLRQATSVDKMEKQLEQIFSTLDLITEKHKSTYDDECKAVKNYIDTVFGEIPKITKEFDHILESRDREDFLENEGETSETDLTEDVPKFFKQQLKLLENLVQEISDWKAILIEEIAKFRENVPTTIRQGAEAWQDTILSRRSYVLESKLDSHFQRREEVKIGIFDVRMQEIQDHTKRLEIHAIEVEQVLKDTSACLEQFLNEQKQLMEICENEIVKAGEQILKAKSTTELKRFQRETENHRHEFNNEKELKVQMHRQELCDILDALMAKNDAFLQDIQLFKDGGNFSAEEAKSYRKSLMAFSKTISKSKTTNEQKFERLIGELDRATENIYKSYLEKCTAPMRDLKFYEDSNRTMKKCAVILERQVDRFLEDNTNCINAVIDRSEKSTTASCELSHTKILAEEISQLLELLDTRLENLIVAFPLVRTSTSHDQSKMRRKSPTENTKNKLKSPSKATNYRNSFLVSDETRTRKNCFSINSMNTMAKALDEIQRESTKFFTSTDKRSETGASYHEYMQQIVQQLNCYREQLENLWRQEVQDLLAAATIFERSIYECIVASLDDFHNGNMKETATSMEQELEILDEMMRVWSTRRDDILASFKISHGHPGRRDSLDELVETVVQEEEQMQKTIIKNLTEFKIDLEGLASSYERSLLELADPLKKILRKLENRDKTQRLRELLDERIRVKSPILTSYPYKLDIGDKSNRRYLKYKRKLPPVRDDKLDIEFVLNGLVEKAKKIYNSAIEEAETSFKNFVKDGEEFKLRWKSSMEIVAQVYQMDAKKT